MKIHKLKELVEERKKEKNAVAELLHGVKKTNTDPDLVNAIQLRMHEMDSFIQVMHAAMESDNYDESFYREHVSGMTCLLEERFNDIQILVDALIQERTEKTRALKLA